MNVLLMFGGKSLESDVSVVSALYIYNLIKDDPRYNKVLVYADYDNVLYTCSELTDIKNYQHLNKLLTKTNEIALLKTSEATILKSHKKSLNGLKIDLILPIMHGEGLEDGIIAGYTKFLQIPSVCPNVLEASMFQDKYITKLLLEKINIKTLEYQLLTKQNQNVTLNLPIIIKPLSLGSSIGITTVTNEQALTKKLQESFTYSNKLLIEPLIENFTEYSLALYKYKDNIYLSNVEKSYTNNEFYTFEDKYVYYLADFIIDNNSVGVGLGAKEMLFNSTSTFSAFSSDNWSVENNKFPILKYFVGSSGINDAYVAYFDNKLVKKILNLKTFYILFFLISSLHLF